MKKLMTAGAAALLFSTALAGSPGFQNYGDEIFVKARATVGACDKVLGKTLAVALAKSFGTGMVCATTKYTKDDTKDFIDINFNDSMDSPWKEGKYFTSGLFTFDGLDTAIGVVLMNDSKTMLIFDVNHD